MTAKQIRTQLFEAFNVSSSKELKRFLKKTDLRKKDEMLHAMNVAWSFGFQGLKNREPLGAALQSLDAGLQTKLGYEAKYGFGSYPA